MDNLDLMIAPRTSGSVSVPTFGGSAVCAHLTVNAAGPRFVAQTTAKRNPGTQAWSPPT